MSATITLAPPPRLRELTQALLLLLLTLLVSYGSLRLSRVGGGVASVWIANGLLAGVLLLTPSAVWRRWLLASALGQALARMLIADPAQVMIALVLVNVGEAWLVAAWVRLRQGEIRDVRSLGALSQAAFVATLVACAVSASLATPVLMPVVTTSVASTWVSWYLAHLLGMVIFATLTVCLAQPKVRLLGRPGFRIDYFACIALLLVAVSVMFLQTGYPSLFLGYVPLALLAFRHGLSGMLSGILLLGVASGTAAIFDTGPFALIPGEKTTSHLLFWQLYLAGGCLLAYPITVAVTTRRQADRQLAASRAQLQAIADNLPARIARFDRDGRYTFANKLARQMAPPELELVGHTLREVRGEEHFALIAPRMAAVLRGEAQAFEDESERESKRRDYREEFVPDIASDGSVQGFYSLTFDITQAKQTERELERLARVDALTGLPNRRHLNEALETAVVRARRTNSALLLLSLDLDHFKQINDTLGHAAGDEVLKVFGERIRDSVYDVDLVSRQGGDEFHVLVQYSPTAEVGSMIAARIIEAMRAPILLAGQPHIVHASIGIGLHHPVQSALQLQALADQALYEAKANGRGTWQLRKG